MSNYLITSIGLLAACLTTFSSLPQLIKIFKTKKTQDISLLTYILVTTGVATWLTYGILIIDIPLIFANFISLIFVFTILIFKIIYK